MTPEVSVVITAYNVGPFLAEAVTSALDQEGVVGEVIVVDDGSTDDTPHVAASFGDRIRYQRIPNSGGPSRPRNVGIGMARAPVIALLDGDDAMLPGYLATAVAALRKRTGVGLLCCDCHHVDREGHVLRERGLADYQRFRRSLRPQPEPALGLLPAREAFHQMLWANFVLTSGALCPREVFRQLGGFDESLPNGDDRDMWLRIVRHGWDVLFLDRPGVDYRKHAASVTARGGRRVPAMVRVLERQWEADLTAEERRQLHRRLAELWTVRGWYLRHEGDYTGARRAYARSLRHRPGPVAALGWLLALLHRRGRD